MNPILLTGLLCALLTSGCGKVGSHSRTTLNINGNSTITAHSDGVTRKLHAPCSFSLSEGRVTALAKGGVLSVQESGGPVAREGEVREKDGAKELWIKEGGAFRKGTPADDLWLEGFLRAVGGESSTSVEGHSIIISGGKVSMDTPKGSAPDEGIGDETVPVPAVLAKLKRRNFSHERQEGIEALMAKRTLEPADQVAVVEAVFDQLDFGHEKVSVLKSLIRAPGFSPEARKAVIRRIDRLSFDHEKVEVQKMLLQLE